jgi:hypothetical protein
MNYMRFIVLAAIMLFFMNLGFSQVKGTGVCYFEGPPTSFTPDTLYDCELAIDVNTTTLYVWNRDNNVWDKNSNGILSFNNNLDTIKVDSLIMRQSKPLSFIELDNGNEISLHPFRDGEELVNQTWENSLWFIDEDENIRAGIGTTGDPNFSISTDSWLNLYGRNQVSLATDTLGSITYNLNNLPITRPIDEGLPFGNYFYTVDQNGNLAETGGWISDDSLASSIVNILNLQTLFTGGDMTTSSTVNIGANELIFRKDSAAFSIPYNTITLLNSPNDSIALINRAGVRINFEVSDTTSRPAERGGILFVWDGAKTQMVIDGDDQLNLTSNIFSRMASDGNVELVGSDTIAIGIDVSNFGGTAESDFIYVNSSVQLAFDAPSYKFFDLPDTDADLRQAVTVNPTTGVMALTPVHGDSLFLKLGVNDPVFVNLSNGINDTINFGVDPLDSLYVKVGLNDPIFIDRYNDSPDTLSFTGLSGGQDITERTIFASNDTVTTSVSIPANYSYKFKVEVIATVTTAGAGGEAVGESAVYEYVTLIKNVAGTTSIVGNIKDILAGGPIEDTNMDGEIILQANDASNEFDISYVPPLNADASTVIEVKVVITGIPLNW